MNHLHLDPDLAYQLEQIRRKCEAERRHTGLLRFGWWMFIATLAATVLLVTLGMGFSRNLVLAGYLIAVVVGFRRTLYRVLKQPITDETVALFIDEHYPELQNRMLSLVALSKEARGRPNSWLVRRFLKESKQFVRREAPVLEVRLPRPRRLMSGPVLLFLAVPAVIWPFARHWTPVWDVSWPWGAGTDGFEVSPGNARVGFGEDVTIFAKAVAGSRSMVLEWRTEGAGGERIDMRLGETEGVYFHTLSSVRVPTTYRVYYGTDVSPTYRLTPWTEPEVEGLEITYHYPEYLKRAPRKVPNAGDITAVEGTRVQLDATVNKPLSRLDLVTADGATVPFTRVTDDLWQGTVTVTENTEYHLAPVDIDGVGAPYHPTYTITAQPDKAPRVRIHFPFRDMEVSPLDEVGFDFEVVDDFGLADYGVRYQVADRAPVDVSLMKEPGQTEVEAQAVHELALEALALEPGDLLTWTVWARDGKPDRPDTDGVGDPFFLEIRPFKRLFRMSVSDGGGGQGGGDDPLTKQKEVLIATWNLRKAAPTLSTQEYGAQLDVIKEAQTAVEGMLDQLIAMSGVADRADGKNLKAAVADSLDALGDAALQMHAATALGEAAEHQQRAYRLLLRMAPEESQVSRSRSNASGAPGRQPAGLSDLELNRDRNMYEEERLTQKQQEAAAEALNKIKDLAQRQKMLNQEIADLISEMEQKQLDAEELKRRLERLREEARKNLEELDNVQRDMATSDMDASAASAGSKKLDEAREQMNRSLEKLQPESMQQARAAGTQALDKLDTLEEDLSEKTRQSAEERMAGLQEQMRKLQAGQQQVQDRINALGEEKDSPRLTAEDPDQVKKSALMAAKDELSKQFEALMEDAASVADITRTDQEHMARKLGDWLRKTSRDGIGEDMEEAKQQARLGNWDGLAEKEARIAEKLEKAAMSLGRVAEAGGDDLSRRRQALNELQHLAELAPQTDENPTEQMERLASETYKDWLEGLRNAEGLLSDSRHGAPLNRVRREIEKMRRDYRTEGLIPKNDAFAEKVLRPLNQTIVDLQKEVTALQEGRAFVLTDDGAVPEAYRKQVAEYFQVLSESEGN